MTNEETVNELKPVASYPTPSPEMGNYEWKVSEYDRMNTRKRAVEIAANLFAQPQFSTQVNDVSIIKLADLMYKYITGDINIPSVQEEVTAAAKVKADEIKTTKEAPKFG